jgi:serine/threonine-protein kinase
MALPVTGASDVYALGVVFYEALSGRLPHTGAGFELLKRIAEDPPTPITDHRDDLPNAVLKPLAAMLEKNPEERPTAQEVRDVLERAVERTPIN